MQTGSLNRQQTEALLAQVARAFCRLKAIDSVMQDDTPDAGLTIQFEE